MAREEPQAALKSQGLSSPSLRFPCNLRFSNEVVEIGPRTSQGASVGKTGPARCELGLLAIPARGYGWMGILKAGVSVASPTNTTNSPLMARCCKDSSKAAGVPRRYSSKRLVNSRARTTGLAP